MKNNARHAAFYNFYAVASNLNKEIIMHNFPLGVSTWNFNGLANPGVISLADNGCPFNADDSEMITDYYRQIADTILGSEISAIELWYNDAVSIAPVMKQLRKLSEAGKIRSVHAPFGININPASDDKKIRKSAVEAYIRSADILNELNGAVLTVHGSAQPALPDDLDSCINIPLIVWRKQQIIATNTVFELP